MGKEDKALYAFPNIHSALTPPSSPGTARFGDDLATLASFVASHLGIDE